MWQWLSVARWLLADVIPDWRDVNVWTLLIPAALFFFGADAVSTGYQRRDGAVPLPGGHCWRAGRRSAKHWFRRAGVSFAMLPQTGRAAWDC